MASKFINLVVSLICSFRCNGVSGHGYMISPPNRASLWRIDGTQPTNYDDNGYFCGGRYVQYEINQGKCGPCGDDWRDPIPRSNENGGTFGNGIIVANYTAGQVIEVKSLITANHLGALYFSLCKLWHPKLPDYEQCFKPLFLADGTDSHEIRSNDFEVSAYVKLPENFNCDRCVLRWHYRTGNSWGRCDDNSEALGCGDQEIFRNCADIAIHKTKDRKLSD
ncbi:uncharacterized protein LOC132705011 [Cylas formicarius]|uniref:uncharacterized protein LOC132705011 n=1 Tax=Cylas formicarius TaxID=197179 RepID=UPI002958C728|nr:uncharacterized protein LOC132705011 [Cylas formicarius]